MTIPEGCCEITSVSKIKVEEHGRKAIFSNDKGLRCRKIKVDGCVINDSKQKSADWIVSRDDVGDIIVELKGKDVDHAVKQVIATAKYWKENGYQTGKMAALVVSSQFPKVTTAVRKAQQDFAKHFNGPLHVVTQNYAGCMKAVSSFKGPHTS